MGPKTFTYDLNGNTLTAGPTGAPDATCGWDASDRLVSVTQGANVTTFEYDSLSRRVREKFNGTETRRWVWCGLELCEERDASNTVTKRFYGQGEQIAGVAYYTTRDHLGSIRELTDTAGAIRARYDYDLYGQRSANLVTVNPVESREVDIAPGKSHAWKIPLRDSFILNPGKHKVTVEFREHPGKVEGIEFTIQG